MLTRDTADHVGESLKRIIGYFTAHPKKNGMTYGQHWYHALSMSCQMALGSFYLAVHAIFPFIFEDHGSTIIQTLSHKKTSLPTIQSCPQFTYYELVEYHKNKVV
jgi:hypothetical protein